MIYSVRPTFPFLSGGGIRHLSERCGVAPIGLVNLSNAPDVPILEWWGNSPRRWFAYCVNYTMLSAPVDVLMVNAFDAERSGQIAHFFERCGVALIELSKLDNAIGTS